MHVKAEFMCAVLHFPKSKQRGSLRFNDVISRLNFQQIYDLYLPKMIVVKFANSTDPDEAAHKELPHLDLHCWSFRIYFSI